MAGCPMTRRLTPEQVLRAYEQTGLRVTRGAYLMPPEDGKLACGCPIGAVLVDERVFSATETAFPLATKDTAIACGFDDRYLQHFTTTFDDGHDTYCEQHRVENCDGCKDALAVTAALVGKGLLQ
jgi:hypothetical protein